MRNDRSLIARRKPQSFSSVEGHESRLQEFSRRFELLKPAVARFPRSSEIRLAYALACYFTGRNDLAEQAYLQLVQMQPNSDQSTLLWETSMQMPDGWRKQPPRSGARSGRIPGIT